MPGRNPRLFPKHPNDGPAPDHPSRTVEHKPRTDDRQRSERHSLVLGGIPNNRENDSGSD